MINMQDRMLSVGGGIPERYQTAGNILGQANVERVATQAMLGQEKAVYKEISKGIVLHKIQMPLVNANDGAEMKYIFKVSYWILTFQIQSSSIKEIDFVADFTGSENIKIEIGIGAWTQSMQVKKEVGSRKTEVIAEVRLLKNWRLKSKFRFTLRNPSLEKQREFILEKLKLHHDRVEQARKMYPQISFSMMTVEQCCKRLKDLNTPFLIDLEFTPTD